MGLLDRISFAKHDVQPPERIALEDGNATIVVGWPGGPEARLSAHALRDACPCAQCVDEGTGKKTLDPATIPADIHVVAIEAVGNYAIKIAWSDGHDTGLYTWETLRRACGLK